MVGIALALDLLDLNEDTPVEDISVEELSYVENGTFNGDEDDLNELSEMGMIDDAEHVDSDDIVRNLAERDRFLAMNGYDSVPSGCNVHHIIPLSQGGLDSADNMILLTEEEHAQITAQHREFYGWNGD